MRKSVLGVQRVTAAFLLGECVVLAYAIKAQASLRTPKALPDGTINWEPVE